VNPVTRHVALYSIAVIAILTSGDALAHSYAGLYEWALHHRLTGWQAWSWPAEIDVFLVVGELALYVAYLDAWPGREKRWPWVIASLGLIASVTGNVGHVQPTPGHPVTLADQATAAISPVAACAGLLIGLLILKMNRERVQIAPGFGGADQSNISTAQQAGAALASVSASGTRETALDPLLVNDAACIIEDARASGHELSQRALAEQLRSRGHRFSNAQLHSISVCADSTLSRSAALPSTR
jgi:hypothetical protein